jgi:exonuclease III
MQWFHNAQVKTKLFISFTLVLCFLLALGYISYSATERMSAVMVNLFDNQLTPIKDIGNAARNAMASNRSLYRYIAETDTKSMDAVDVEIATFDNLMKSLDFIDIVRDAYPQPQKLASWWSYRAQDFRQSNRGLRLDHLLLSPGLREASLRQGAPSARIHDDVREWEKPSDHAPVSVDLGL